VHSSTWKRSDGRKETLYYMHLRPRSFISRCMYWLKWVELHGRVMVASHSDTKSEHLE